MNIFALIVLIIIGFVGAGLVIAGALLIRRFFSTDSRLLPRHFVISHSLIILTFMALAPTGIFYGPEPVDDIYGLYLLAPGIHLFWLGEQISWVCSPGLFKMFSNHEASMIGIVIIPGLTGLILGGIQWFLLGCLFQKLSKHSRRS